MAASSDVRHTRSERRPSTPRRLLALWRMYAHLDLVFMLRDIRAALSYFFSDIVLNVAAVTGVWLLAQRFSGLGDWSIQRLMFMLGFAVAASGLTSALFNYNVAWISRRVGRGQLDHLLVQPQPLWMALLTEGFAPVTGSAPLLTGLALLAWGAWSVGVALSPAWLALFALNLVASASVILAFSYLWGSLAFWAPRSAEEVSSSAIRLVEQLKPYPLDGMRGALRGGLVSIVPAGLVGWLPSRALLGLSSDPLAVWLTPLAAAALALAATLAFRKGLAQYALVGSRRYTDFGHRR